MGFHKTYHPKQGKEDLLDIKLVVKYGGLKATQYFTKFDKASQDAFRQDLLQLRIPHPKSQHMYLITHGIVGCFWSQVSPHNAILRNNLKSKLRPQDPEAVKTLRLTLESLSIVDISFKEEPADPQLAQTVIAKRPNPSEEDLDDRPTKYRKPNYPQSTDSNSTSSSYYHPKTPFPFKKILNSSANASQPSYGSADTQWQAGAEPPYQLQPPMPKPHSGKITSGKASRFGPPVESSSLPPRVKPEPIEPDLQNLSKPLPPFWPANLPPRPPDPISQPYPFPSSSGGIRAYTTAVPMAGTMGTNLNQTRLPQAADMLIADAIREYSHHPPSSSPPPSVLSTTTSILPSTTTHLPAARTAPHLRSNSSQASPESTAHNASLEAMYQRAKPTVPPNKFVKAFDGSKPDIGYERRSSPSHASRLPPPRASVALSPPSSSATPPQVSFTSKARPFPPSVSRPATLPNQPAQRQTDGRQPQRMSPSFKFGGDRSSPVAPPRFGATLPKDPDEDPLFLNSSSSNKISSHSKLHTRGTEGRDIEKGRDRHHDQDPRMGPRMEKRRLSDASHSRDQRLRLSWDRDTDMKERPRRLEDMRYEKPWQSREASGWSSGRHESELQKPQSGSDHTHPQPSDWNLQRDSEIARLNRELEDAKKEIARLVAHERDLVEDLKARDVHVPPPSSGRTKEEEDLHKTLNILKTQLEGERKLRKESQLAIADIRRECREPFVVPSLLDAFLEMSRITNLVEQARARSDAENLNSQQVVGGLAR